MATWKPERGNRSLARGTPAGRFGVDRGNPAEMSLMPMLMPMPIFRALAGALALAACAPVVPVPVPIPAPPPAPAPAPSPAPAPAPATVRPGAPGEATRAVAPGAATHRGPRYNEADVRFMQGMIPHHAQAVVMTDLVAERTDNEAVRALAHRIALSQEDEMAVMRRWLAERGETVPAADALHHAAMGHGEMMPGMLTPEELDRLAAARGTEFDRLFLRFMIRHHEGALAMVDRLFASGGGQEGEMYQFASHVGSDQRVEIARMAAVLATIPGALPPGV